MADARAMKFKEYGTDLISHSSQNIDEPRNVRFNNTFKSSILDTTPNLN